MTESRSYAHLIENVMKNNFKYAFKQDDLWELAEKKKVKKYKLKDMKHWIYYPCWSIKGHDNCFLSIYQVLLQPKQFLSHIKRIKKAKLKYPLIVIEDKYDKFGSILDGNHRFAKIILEKKGLFQLYILQKKSWKK